MFPFDADKALADIHRICEFGPRPSGTQALERTRQFLEGQFQEAGIETKRQSFHFSANSRRDVQVEGINLIASIGPERQQRVLFGTHYDTRPIADREIMESRRRQPILGANDGGSGVAVLLEMARLLARSPCNYGFDFVFFDAEEYVFDPDLDDLILGSTHFAEQLSGKEDRYKGAIIVDIVGRDGQTFSPDSYSWHCARKFVDGLWQAGRMVNPDLFLDEVRFEVVDDHVPLLNVGIPSALLIDVEDPRWHTLDDRPEYCSAKALNDVGKTLVHWVVVQAGLEDNIRPVATVNRPNEK